MATPEPSGQKTGRPEHPNPEKAEENGLKYNFMKMIETLKEEMKNFLKEMEEKTKAWMKSINLLKKGKKPPTKPPQIKQVNQAV